MRLFATVVVVLAFTSVASGGGGRTVRAQGVALTMPAGWHGVASAGDGPVTDPRTLLVVGTVRVAPKPSQCQIAAYRVPAHGAVVVIVGWKDRDERRRSDEPGALAAKEADLREARELRVLRGTGGSCVACPRWKAYQVNVMVGNSTPAQQIAEALAIGPVVSSRVIRARTVGVPSSGMFPERMVVRRAGSLLP